MSSFSLLGARYCLKNLTKVDLEGSSTPLHLFANPICDICNMLPRVRDSLVVSVYFLISGGPGIDFHPWQVGISFILPIC